MATQALPPPNFSEDAAWLPCWLQNLGKVSQAPSDLAAKDLVPSQENGGGGKDFNAREEDRYKSCHLFLSGDDSSPFSVAPSPGNVFHFSLRLSSDVDSFFYPTQDLNQSHDAVAPSKAVSSQLAQPSKDCREKLHSVSYHRACEQDVLAAPEIVEKDASISPMDITHISDSVRHQQEKSEVDRCKSADVSNAVELSIAASEALVIHDLVKMESVSETSTEAVLEVALRVKQARLEGLEDDFHSSCEESDCSDSLSDLNDSFMEDAYKDIGLSIGVSFEENLCSPAIFQAKGVSSAENYDGRNHKHSDRGLTSQLANFDDKSQPNQLEVHVELEMQQNTDSSLDSVHGESEMHSNDPGLGANTPQDFANALLMPHQYIENNTNVLALNQALALTMDDLTSIKQQNSVNSSFVETSGSSKKENWATYLAPERFRSRWLGGWTSKELDSSSLNRNNAERIPKFVARETSFLTESVDIVPDENSCVLKPDPKCARSSQLSMASESIHNKPDESVLHSQDVVTCSNLSLVDPLCSVVPCSIASEHANDKNHADKENDTEDFVPSTSEFEVDNFQRISDKNFTCDSRDKKIMSILDGEDIPITPIEVVKQMSEKLTRVEHTGLKTYSMILPNQALNLNCNLRPFPTEQSRDGASLSTRIPESPASKQADGNKNEENHLYLVDHTSVKEITDDQSDELKLKETETTQERRSPLILNHRMRRRLVGAKNVVNDISTETNIKQNEVPEAAVQPQQNNNLKELQLECNKIHGRHVRVRKQVRFSEKVEELHQKRKFSKLESSLKRCSSVTAKRPRASKSLTTSVPHKKNSLTNYCRSVVNEFIFKGTEFLLTGLSSQKERDTEALIRNSGGVVLFDIPSPPNSRGKRSSTLSRMQLPIILCRKKLQTIKFLYGCAVGASILKVDWLNDCLASGTILQPEKYMILPNRKDMQWTSIGTAVRHRNRKHVFERVGVMLHGKPSFCTKLACIIKHGGGQVFKTLQWLVRSTDEQRTSVGVIVIEDKATISRHLKHCALERAIPTMPCSWIIESLYLGKLLPFTEENNANSLPFVKVPDVPCAVDMSEEI
ncbi:uncharacterized protein LOC130749280 [Lotus japonicus]|uniref:uncharacterized protein LOC130749280 n=1 Tax=Lotus japonicus TaxID=34305 RepID=UPI0025850AFC|nr:uncharacterized protein LOC130749280 [Lotus japonicus]